MKSNENMKCSVIITFSVVTLFLGSASCNPAESAQSPEIGLPDTPNPDKDGDNDHSGNGGEDGGNNNENNDSMNHKLTITVGNTSFTATLYDNATATAFKAMLPMTADMSEMNGNEKLYYLPNRLSTTASNPGTIQAGDLMLWGSDCLVLFYKSFSTSYSYTRLGRVENAAGLESAVGRGNVKVTFKQTRTDTR